MAHTRQALKRLRTNTEKHLKNRSAKSSIKTASAKVTLAAQEQKKEETGKLLSEVYSQIDKAVKQGILHKNTAARKKSRLAQATKKAQTAKPSVGTKENQ